MNDLDGLSDGLEIPYEKYLDLTQSLDKADKSLGFERLQWVQKDVKNLNYHFYSRQCPEIGREVERCGAIFTGKDHTLCSEVQYLRVTFFRKLLWAPHLFCVNRFPGFIAFVFLTTIE